VGLIQRDASEGRGALTLYVPEYYLDTREWPLIVALHGGRQGRGSWAGSGGEGRHPSRPVFLGSTWDPADDAAVSGLVDDVAARYRVDRRRVLLTGMSDGATFTFIFGLAHPDRFRALAPLCGVLHPAVLTQGTLENGRNLPVYMVHGAKDWIFPIETARMAARVLEERKIDHVFRELPALSHAYPRRENEHILNWFEEKARERA
jgi:phospholipase/carboxylesterase